jgi:hypothetical protein
VSDHPQVRHPQPTGGDIAQPGIAPPSDTNARALPWTLIRHPWVRAVDARSIGTDGDTQRSIDAGRSTDEIERRAA